MNKEFVKYETALALKELGFDEPCFGYYDTVAVTYLTYPSAINKNSDIENSLSISKEDKNVRCSAPTYSQAFRWMRENHGLYDSINIHADNMWSVVVKSMTSNSTHTSGYVVDLINKGYSTFKTYEEAESACLDKLIEICKNK